MSKGIIAQGIMSKVKSFRRFLKPKRNRFWSLPRPPDSALNIESIWMAKNSMEKGILVHPESPVAHGREISALRESRGTEQAAPGRRRPKRASGPWGWGAGNGDPAATCCALAVLIANRTIGSWPLKISMSPDEAIEPERCDRSAQREGRF